MSTIITKKQFNNHIYKTEIAGRPFSLEFGKVAELANASAMVRYGDTSVLVAVTAAPRPRDGVDFFPLSVDFEEKLYAVGRIPGSFMRREGQPSLPAVLASRVIDRSIRPLFPGDFRNDVVVTCTVMSVDRDCSPEAAAMVGVSACLAVSNIPWGGPIGCLEVGYVDGQIVMNPNQAQKHASKLDLTVAATGAKVVMIEAGADQLPDEIMYEAIVKAHEEIKAQVDFINAIVAEIGKEKMTYDHADFDQELFDKIVAATMDEAKAAREKAAASQQPAPDLSKAARRLEQRFTDVDFWAEQTAKCLSCGACTYMCPTCQCFNISDEGNTLEGRRLRSWDNCMSPLFTREASGHNPRTFKALRMRNRVSHKYWYAPDYSDGRFACTGCGRCIKQCPVSLDIREIVLNAIADDAEAK